MMPTTEPTPPILELPDEINDAIGLVCDTWWESGRTQAQAERGPRVLAVEGLHQTIRAALDDEWDKGFRQAVTDHVELVENIKALRERCERLRLKVIAPYLANVSVDTIEEVEELDPGDLADDLRLRGGDETDG